MNVCNNIGLPKAHFRMNKIIITLLLCSCATAYGAEVDNALLKKNLETATIQIEVLKAQVDVMKSYQDKFLSTVYWSLGTVAALVVFLAGFNWFTNNRNAEKESALHKEMIANELNRLQNEINTKISESLSATDDELNKILDTLKAEFRATVILEYEKKLSKINLDLKQLKRKFLEDKYEEALGKSVYPNAIRYACDLLDLSQNEHEILDNTSNALFKIENVLKKVKEENKGANLKPNIVSKLTSSLEPFEDKHGIVIKRILQQLSGI